MCRPPACARVGLPRWRSLTIDPLRFPAYPATCPEWAVFLRARRVRVRIYNLLADRISSHRNAELTTTACGGWQLARRRRPSSVVSRRRATPRRNCATTGTPAPLPGGRRRGAASCLSRASTAAQGRCLSAVRAGRRRPGPPRRPRADSAAARTRDLFTGRGERRAAASVITRPRVRHFQFMNPAVNSATQDRPVQRGRRRRAAGAGGGPARLRRGTTPTGGREEG